LYHNVRCEQRKIKICLRDVGREDGGGCVTFIFLVLRFSVCCYNDRERERERERECEERDKRLHSLTQSSGTLLEVIAKCVYNFKMLSSH